MKKKNKNYEICDLKLFTMDDIDVLLHKILKQVRETLNVEAGTIYTVDDDVLKFNVFQNDSMEYEQIYLQYKDLKNVKLDIQKGDKYLAVHAYKSEKIIIVNDVYNTDDYEFAGVKEYDTKYNYKTYSIMTAPIIDPMEHQKLGVLQLINKLDGTQKVAFNEQDKNTFSIALSLIALTIFQAKSDFLKLQELNEKLKVANKSLEQRVEYEVSENEKKSTIIYNQAKLASMGEMVGNIAHQWRQPLSSISTIASALSFDLEYREADKKKLIPSLNKIVDTTKYLSDTINDFRNFYKNDKSLELFNVSTNIQQCMVIIESTLLYNNIKVIFDLDETLGVEGLKNELKQVVLNIIQNAKDALVMNMPKKDRYIFITLQKVDDFIFLDIKDNAGGIDEDLLERIFEKDFTTKSDLDGTGIGLHMTKLIIEKSFNGKISAANSEYIYNNKKYKGALFTIGLPAK